MTRRWPFLGAALILTALLAGCSSLGPRFDADAAFTPTVLGFEVDEDQITITGHSIVFVSRPGSIGATIEGYEVEFLDNAGAPLVPGEGPLVGSLGVEVPPGLSCTSPDPCTFRSPGLQYVPRASEPRNDVVTLTAPFAEAVMELGSLRGTAVFTFYGTGADGRPVEIVEEISIEVPVGE